MQQSTQTTEQQQDITGEVNITNARASTENVLQAMPQQLIDLQQTDPTLKIARELAENFKGEECNEATALNTP